MALEDEFRKAAAARIVYNGKEIFLHHQFPITDEQQVQVTIESFDPDWGGMGRTRFHEGVGLMIDKRIKIGSISCRYLALWPNYLPWEQLQLPYFRLQEVEVGYYIEQPKNTVSLWLRNPFESIKITCATQDGHVHVQNIWNDGNVRHAIDRGHNGAGMIVEKIKTGFRYHCNDGYPDEDFNDIVFRIE